VKLKEPHRTVHRLVNAYTELIDDTRQVNPLVNPEAVCKFSPPYMAKATVVHGNAGGLQRAWRA